MRDTLARLAAHRSPAGWPGAGDDRLDSLPAVAINPGALGARCYVPAGIPRGAPLVVVLHGCTQTAAGYDAGTGWSRLADRSGFAVLFPEQGRANNPNLCFNWFEAADIARRGGEAESIARMVEAMVGLHGLDRERVFVTGLSAGGAMAAVMLATYPDLFAGGAIIGGLPYSSADSVAEALQRMRRPVGNGARSLAVAASGASGLEPGRWPTVSLWHGSADATVVPGNMEDLAVQWRGVHGVAATLPKTESGPGWTHRSWEAGGRTVVEAWLVEGMGHGVPIDLAQGLGTAGPYMLPVGIDSTTVIARSWGIAPEADDGTHPHPVPVVHKESAASTAARVELRPASRGAPAASGVQKVIEDALRTAGLMR